MTSKVIDIENLPKESDYQLEPYGNKNKATIIIAGEKHGDSVERQYQEELVKRLKPEYVLVEDITNSDFESWEEKYGCKVEPCDLSTEEFLKKARELGISTFFSGFETNVKFHKPREKKMGRVFYRYSRKSSKPLIAVIGNWHVRTDSEIHEVLKRNNVDYLCTWNEEEVKKTRDRQSSNV